MRYRIEITRTEPNPNFDEEVKEMRALHRFNDFGRQSEAKRELITNALFCEISEEQFKKVRAEMVKIFE
jgi:hypothetical protein